MFNRIASIAIMIGGATLNATAFIGGSYLAKHLTGSDSDEEKKRNDLAVEKYQNDYHKFQENRNKLQDWIQTNERTKSEAKQRFTVTDYAFKLYNQTHKDKIDLKEPKFSDYYKPSDEQKQGELVYVGTGAILVGYIANKFISL